MLTDKERADLISFLNQLRSWEHNYGYEYNHEKLASIDAAIDRLEQMVIPEDDSLKHMTSHGRDAKTVSNHPSIKLIDGKKE